MPIPPALSPKDSNQVLRAVMDDDNNRLRVDAVISPDGHDLEIHYQDDSIAIGDPATDNILGINSDKSITSHISDGTNELKINTDGSINVISGEINSNISIYNEITSVGSGILTTINTYTALTSVFLERVYVSGSNIGIYIILINGSIIDKTRTSFTEYNNILDYNNYSLNSGDILTIKVIHNRPYVGDFNSRIQIMGK